MCPIFFARLLFCTPVFGPCALLLLTFVLRLYCALFPLAVWPPCFFARLLFCLSVFCPIAFLLTCFARISFVCLFCANLLLYLPIFSPFLCPPAVWSAGFWPTCFFADLFLPAHLGSQYWERLFQNTTEVISETRVGVFFSYTAGMKLKFL